MLKKRGRPKEPLNVKKINPPNVIMPPVETTITGTNILFQSAISYKCDVERCNSKAEVFLNLKYCKLCAKDKGFEPDNAAN